MKNSYLTVTDQFCGAGGSSIGATRAGAEIKLAMNHWKLAIETHNSNFPNVDHVCTDISATDPRRYPSTNILITSPECFPAGSLVLTKTGFKPIEEVKIGDRVLTHLNRWRPVVRTQKSIGDTVIIRGQGHTVGIEVTPNHRFYVRTQSQEWDNRKRDYNRRIYGDPEWLAAEDLARGTYRWCTPIKVIAEAWPMPVGFGENEEIAWWLVGRWLGDGSLGGDGEVVISCGYHKAANLESQLYVTGGNWRAYRKRTAMNFVLYDRQQGKWLSQYFGRGAEHKYLPGWILEMPKSLRGALLEGYLSADGHRGIRRTRADTVSKALALGMRMLAESLGYRAGIYRYEQHTNIIEGRHVNTLPIWAVAWENNASERSAFEDADHSWSLIKSIKPGQRNIEVYNLEVADDHSYVVEGIVVANCTNHSLAKGKPRRFYERDIFDNVLIDPAEERSRATMWDVPRFAEYHDYEIIVVENVVDAGKWRLWDSWLSAMHALGYDHKAVYFNSMFAWPTPQSRDRMYTVFWKRGNTIPDLDIRPIAPCNHCGKTVKAIQTWKKQKHWGRYKAQYFYRCPNCNLEVHPYYYAAFNAIDWSIISQRIGDRKIPLKPKTMERIKYGLEKYGRNPLIVTGRYTSGIDCRVKNAVTDPMPTQPGDSSHAVVFPWLVETGHTQASDHLTISASDPDYTQTTRQTMGLVGFLSKQYGGDPKHKALGLDDPFGTITTMDHHALLSTPPAFIAELRGQSKAAGIDEPLMCVTAGGGHHGLVSADAFLTYYYGTHNASGLTEPIHTITGVHKAGLIGALQGLTVDDLTFRMLKSHEVGRAMAFSDDYVVLGTERDRVKQYGNAVTPPVMEMILKRLIETLS